MREIIGAYRTPYMYPSRLLAPTGGERDFDAAGVETLSVYQAGDEYHMLYFGHDMNREYSAGLAVSRDLIHWERRGKVLDRGGPGSFDQYGVAIGSVLRTYDGMGERVPVRYKGKYWGVYNGFDGPGFEAGLGSLGLIRSGDLIHWEKCSDKPILHPSDGEDWECGTIYKAGIFLIEGTFHMFYNAKGKEKWPWIEQTGLATSKDLIHWERFAGNPVLRVGESGAFDCQFASDPYVLRHEDVWLMFYASYDGEHARVGAAFSEDMVNWRKWPEPVITTNEELDIHASKPVVLYRDGIVYHFINGVRTPCEGDPEICREIGRCREVYLFTSKELP